MIHKYTFYTIKLWLKVFLMRHIGLKDTSSDEAPVFKTKIQFYRADECSKLKEI